MESFKGSGPYFNTVACDTIAFDADFFDPVLGSIAISAVCTLLMEFSSKGNGESEWW